MIVNGGDLEVVLLQARDDGVELFIGQYEISVDDGDGVVARGLERGPAPEREARFDRDAGNRDLEIGARQRDLVDVADDLARFAHRAIDRRDVEAGGRPRRLGLRGRLRAQSADEEKDGNQSDAEPVHDRLRRRL